MDIVNVDPTWFPADARAVQCDSDFELIRSHDVGCAMRTSGLGFVLFDEWWVEDGMVIILNCKVCDSPIICVCC